jgi:archaellum component FlaC
MGFGSTAKKLQQTVDIAEDLYGKMNDLRERIGGLEETVASTNENVESLETDLAEQRALVEALAEEQGVDVDEVVANAGAGDAADDAADAPTPDGND